MESETKEKIIEIIKSVVGIDVSSIDESTKINTISEWDSFNTLMLISKFEEEFKITFTAVEVSNTYTVKDLFDLLEKKLSK